MAPSVEPLVPAPRACSGHSEKPSRAIGRTNQGTPGRWRATSEAPPRARLNRSSFGRACCPPMIVMFYRPRGYPPIRLGPRLLVSFLIEVSQIRRLLALLDRHQVAIRTQQIVLVADRDVVVAFDTVVFRPNSLLLTTVVSRHRPRARQRMIDRGHFVVKNIRIVLIEVNPLLDDAFAVLVERNAALIVDRSEEHTSELQ